MNFRLKTSFTTAESLKNLQSLTGLTWNILARIAISLSLKDPSIPKELPDFDGVDIHRNALTGENDYIYKTLIAQHAQENISDEDFFPKLFNEHLDRGISLLESEYEHAGNFDKFIINLINLRD